MNPYRERPDLAETVLHQKISLGEKKNDCEGILAATCALFNSGGGVLEIKLENYSHLTDSTFWKKLDSIWQTFENKLAPAIQPLSYSDLIDRKMENDVISLFIKAPDHLITLENNLFLAGDARTHEASFNKTLELLADTPRCKFSLEKLPCLPETFVYEETLDFHETRVIQLKDHSSSSKKVVEKIKKERYGIQKQLSAFANVTGGIALLGVSDKSIVHGYPMDSDRNSLGKCVQVVESLIGEMEWCCTPRRSIHWDVKFFPVQNTENHFVVGIYVAGMEGAVFARGPKSYKVGYDTAHLLTFEEWKQRVTSGKHMLEVVMKRGVLKKKIAKFQKRFLAKGVLLSPKDSVGEIRESFFKVSEGCPIYPRGFEENLPEEAKLIVKLIQQRHASSRACIVAALSWRACIKRRARDEACQQDIFCDLLLFDCQLGGLHLFTLIKSCSTVKLGRSYSYNVAKTLKKALVLDGGCYERFYIGYHVVHCHRCNSEFQPDFCSNLGNRYPSEYTCEEEEDNEEKLNGILESLISILAAVPSILSKKKGICFYNLLTEEQFGLLYDEINHSRELWIKGAPGTGKTLVAVEFIKELRNRDPSLRKEEILYVCENVGLKQQISNLGLCSTVSRERFVSKYKRLAMVKHVIMDGLENFREEYHQSRTSWLKMGRHIVSRRLNCGYLWLFFDDKQINHDLYSGMPDERERVPLKCLTKVVRNSQRIMEYASKCHEHGTIPFEMGHDFKGEHVEERSYRNGCQISTLREIIKSLYSEGYDAGDIAILYGDKKAIPPNLKFALSLGRIVKATCNDENCLVVSTFHKYSGLHRAVVILVNVASDCPERGKNAMYCCATRAMIKLIVLTQE